MRFAALGGDCSYVIVIPLPKMFSVCDPPPVVEVAQVEQKDVRIYGEWIGTLTGQVNADVKSQVTGYLLMAAIHAIQGPDPNS